MPNPIYTPENVRLAYELRFSVSLFWAAEPPPAELWLFALKKSTESDGVRILEHRFAKRNVSQFLVSSEPRVAPSACLRSIKGRLQHLIRATLPKAFHRNYSIHTVGSVNQAEVEGYVTEQLSHHRLVDPRMENMLAPYQMVDPNVQLGSPRRSSYGEFIYNLHLTAVHQQRYAVSDEECWKKTIQMMKGVASKKGHLISRVGLLMDHIHWTVGCGIEETPLQVGLSYLNNLADAHGMRPLYQFGFYAGTFGPYDMNAIRMKLAEVSDG